MLFNAPVFLFAFLPAAWAGFRLISCLNHKASLLWLVGASMVFYGWWNPRFVPLLLLSMAGNYLAGETIRALGSRPAAQRTILTFAIASNILLLGYYKYLTAIVGFLIVHGAPLAEIGRITLPLGISFFTFTQIAYLLDVAAGVADERDPVSYALFVTFFPHLIAGPILHHAEMMPQFRQPGALRFNPQDLMVGIAIFTFGLAKKNLIADPTSLSVAPAFDHAAQLELFGAWRAALSYSLQLYFGLLGLFGYGHRAWPHVRHPLPAEFQLALQGRVRHRILAALAHDADPLPDAVSVQSAGAGRDAPPGRIAPGFRRANRPGSIASPP